MCEMNRNLVEKFKSIVNENIHREGISSLMNWLESNDFYTAPASTKFHGNFVSGLLAHSIRVYECLKSKQTEESNETIAIVSLFHDLCKVNFYKEHKTVDKCGNVKISYSIDDKLPIGHGEKSVILLLKHMDLTDEEMLVIRWHMGAYDVSGVGKSALSTVMHKYRLALKLQQADEEAACWYNE